MNKKRLGPYSFGIIAVLGLFTVLPVFAEVTSIETDSEYFFKNEKITFTGTVEKNSNGLVSIVIRDTDDKFVTLEQAIIGHDYTFTRTVPVKDHFSEHGIYKATGFILSLEKGATVDFEISLDGTLEKNNITNDKESPVVASDADVLIPENTIADFVDTTRDPQYYVDRYYSESSYKEWFDRNYPEITIEQAVGYKYEPKIILQKAPEPPLPEPLIPENTLVDFVDTTRDPQYYVDRYYNESSYKEWFDRNYPEITIEQAVGYDDTLKDSVQGLIDAQIIPKAEASSIVQIESTSKNSDVAQVSLAIAALGILFGAVYGIKRKVDDNSKQISINRNTIRKKIIHPIIGNNPEYILKTRLAKGEITLEEYERLNSKIK